MSSYDINSLNEEQRQALLETEGVVLVTAGAGSGKTRLLTHRICYLIEHGVAPYNILAITFTNKATNEMKERVLSMGCSGVWISTFHSMCVRILRENIHYIEGYDKNFTIVTEADRDKILKDLLKKYQCEDDEKQKVETHLDNIKNKGLDIDEYFLALREYDKSANLKIYEKICFEYEQYLHKNNSLDFDDLLNKTLFLFNNYKKEVLNKYAERFRYILVDEFQDTNVVQYKLVKLLSSVHKNLFVVGDEDQCIYSWRGANFHNIANLKNDFENVKVFKLERNYRSTKNILTLANNVISNNRDRIKKELWTDKDQGTGPVVYNAFDERDEALFVAKTISDLLSEGYSYSDFAVLMRINALSRSFEDAFLSYDISYKLYGGFKFYERAEIRVILSYLSVFVNPKDEISLLKIINFPKRGIGDAAIAKLQEEAGESTVLEYLLSDKFAFSKYKNKLESFVSNFKNLRDEMNAISLSDFVEKVIKTFGINLAYAGRDEEAINRLGNIDSLLSSVREYEDENEGATLSDYLANIMLRSDSDQIQENGFVSIATIHAVKGLEFKVVFVVGLEEGIFPLARATLSSAEMEEERRLMYVAITRAEEKIFLVHASKRFMYGKSNFQVRSRFVGELGIVDKKKPRLNLANDNFFKAEKEETFDSGFAVGDKVFFARFGNGRIVNISDDGMVGDIEFEDVGMKSIMLNSKALEKVEDDE
ncbi:MAG: ATP-dependent helicase [Candidatus Caccovivens sp.]